MLLRRAGVVRFSSLPVTPTILEAGQVADWVIEQLEHSLVFGQPGKCESAVYDGSGNTWRQFEKMSEKLKPKQRQLTHMLEDMAQHIHLDDCGLDDFDTLVLAKLLKYRCGNAKLLDLNNNPLIGDMGAAHVSKHLLSGGVKLRSLFMSNCGISDVGVSHLADPLRWPEQTMHILELRNNAISDAGAEMLAKVLGKPRSGYAFSLYLNGNTSISEQGILALAKAAIEAEGSLKVCLKDAGLGLSAQDKAELAKVTRNRLRF